MSEEVKYQIIRSFGPSVFKIKIPKSIIEMKINDQIIKDKQKQTEGKIKSLISFRKRILETSENFYL